MIEYARQIVRFYTLFNQKIFLFRLGGLNGYYLVNIFNKHYYQGSDNNNEGDDFKHDGLILFDGILRSIYFGLYKGSGILMVIGGKAGNSRFIRINQSHPYDQQ